MAGKCHNLSYFRTLVLRQWVRFQEHWCKQLANRQLVGALRPVNHKGLHQGCTQTSLHLQVIHFTSHFTTSHVFFKPIYIPRALNTANSQCHYRKTRLIITQLPTFGKKGGGGGREREIGNDRWMHENNLKNASQSKTMEKNKLHL